MLSSEPPRPPYVPADLCMGERTSLNGGTSPYLQLPTRSAVPSYFLSSSFSLLPFILPGYVGIFLVLLGVQGPLLAFSRCCVGTASRVDVFLIHLWGERNSMSSYSSTILEKTHLPFNKSILLIFFWNLIFSIVR